MIAVWLFWANFWLTIMTEPFEPPPRHTAQIFQLDDYRPKPNGDGKKPPERAA